MLELPEGADVGKPRCNVLLHSVSDQSSALLSKVLLACLLRFRFFVNFLTGDGFFKDVC